MRDLGNIKRVVIKVGTSTLTYSSGSANYRSIEKLTQIISDLKNSGRDVVFVTSGAIGLGVAKLKLDKRPSELSKKQACASVGQNLLMGVYDKFFGEYAQTIGQVLLNKYTFTIDEMYENAKNTFNALFEYGVIPVVNENDVLSHDQIKFGDNDTLSAYVANIVDADLLILMTDVDGLYDKNPRTHKDAKIITEVFEITDEMRNSTSGTGTSRGTGGMITKLMAVEIASKSNTKTVILNGENPALIYDIMDGKQVGTYFCLHS